VTRPQELRPLLLSPGRNKIWVRSVDDASGRQRAWPVGPALLDAQRGQLERIGGIARFVAPRLVARCPRCQADRQLLVVVDLLDDHQRHVAILGHVAIPSPEIAEASRLDAELSRARFEPVDLGHIIEEMLPTWESRADGVEIAFARPRAGTAVIMGDESRLARLIDNLVDNAISFSPPGGLVDLRASAVGDEVVLTVEDEGPGVPPESREVIFHRFHSIRGPDHFGRHSGLGLAIAKAIVEGHDGRIEVEDRHDGRRGARFVVRFPGVSQ